MASIVLSNTPAATKPDENGVVYLVPRPLAREVASFVLLPLLPMKPPLRPLPAELWVHVFRHRFEAGVDAQWKELVTVSRAFKVRRTYAAAFYTRMSDTHDRTSWAR